MLGFALLKRSFQFVDIQYVDGKPVIKQFAKRDTPVPFTQLSLLDFNAVSEFRKLIEEAVNAYHLEGAIAVSLDSRLAMIKKILVDVTTPDQEVEEQINWEMRQVLPEELLPDYSFSYESLPGGYYNGQKAFLVVAVRKDVIEAVQKLFANTSLSVEFLELDILASLNAVNRLFGIKEKEMCMVADLRHDIINLLVVGRGEYFDLKRIPLGDSESNEDMNIYDSAEKRASLLIKEARRFLLDRGIDEQNQQVESLFLFGETASEELMDKMKEADAFQDISVVEPFEKIESGTDMEEMIKEMDSSSVYTISVGSALRSVLW